MYVSCGCKIEYGNTYVHVYCLHTPNHDLHMYMIRNKLKRLLLLYYTVI